MNERHVQAALRLKEVWARKENQMKSWILVVGLAIANQFVHAQQFNAETCGTNVREVQQIIDQTFPHIGAGHVRLFLGKWTYGFVTFSVTTNKAFSVQGDPIYICPRADKKFDLFWVDNKNFAGTLAISGRNQVTVYQSRLGDIAFDRAGAQTAGGRY
jgi:hypothetical protein